MFSRNHTTRTRWKWLRRLVWAGVVSCLLTVTLPWWVAWGVKLASPYVGLQVERLETRGWDEWIFHRVSWQTEHGTLKLHATRIYVPNPIFIILRETGEFVVDDWEVSLREPGHHETEEASLGGIPEDYVKLHRYWQLLETWKLQARFSDGIVHYESAHHGRVDRIVLNSEFLKIDGGWLPADKQAVPFSFFLSRRNHDTLALTLNSTQHPATVTLTLQGNPEEVSFEGVLSWYEHNIELAGAWGKQGSLPRSFALKTEAFKIPEQLFSLQHYQSPTVSMKIAGEWDGTRFTLEDLSLTGIHFPNTPEELIWDAHFSVASDDFEQWWVQAQISNPTLVLDAESRLTWREGILEAEVAQLDLATPTEKNMTLEQPFHFVLNTEEEWLRMTGFTWVPVADWLDAPELEIRLAEFGRERGDIQMSLKHLSLGWLNQWYEVSAETISLVMNSLEMEASWDAEKTLEGKLAARLAYSERQQNPFVVDFSLDSQDQSIHLPYFTVTRDERILLTGQGTLPFTIDPNREEDFWVRSLDAPLSLEFRTTDHFNAAEFSSELSAFEIASPSLVVNLGGSLRNPLGSVHIKTKHIRIPEDIFQKTQLPPVDDLELKFEINEQSVTLKRAVALIAGAPVEGWAQLPMGIDLWKKLWSEKQLPSIDKMEGRLDLDRTEVSRFSAFLPPLVRPTGHVQFSIELQPNRGLSGSLLLEGAETMPLLPLGSVENIRAELNFTGRTLELVDLRAKIGGRPLTTTGRIHLDEHWQPRFDLSFSGQNVPFVRSPGLIVRGSPDLSLKTNEAGETTLSGQVTLEESFFMMDLTALQGGGSSPASRPPYFSITDPSFSQWRLNLDIKGREFLRARTPLFESMLSAELNLGGTLLEPRMVGQIEVSQGVIMFPFAAFKIQEGVVTFEKSDPYHPRIKLNARTRAYGYDLAMRMDGLAQDPAIVFTSTPALDSSQILLMVSAGRIPENGGARSSSASRLSGLGAFIGNNVLTDLGLIDPLDDRLQIKTGEDISDLGRDTIDVEYQLSEDWSITGEYDRFDAYNFNFKWKVYSK